ncbi:hypothetical protein FJZ36_02025 [Candidatus Poribacteria bacterium]|nr:hypothetical protein [Candidatus Poribacteria bacterium]
MPVRKQWRKVGAVAILTYALAGIWGTAHAAKENAGAWLLEPVGARAIALQAYTPLSDDVASVSLNPAGLGKMGRVEALFYTRENSYDIHENYLAAVWPKVGPGAIGVAWRNAGAGDSDDAPFIYTDPTGADIGRGQYSANALTFAYGIKANDDMQLGIGIDYALDSFSGLDGTAYADDADGSGFGGLSLGLAGSIPDLLQYGVSVRNLAGSLGEDSSIPVTMSAGVATVTPGRRSVLLSMDVEKQFVELEERTLFVRMGAEYRIAPVALRLGTSQSADRSRWFAGFGVSIADIRADYAFQFINRTARGLEDVPRHFVSLSYAY